MPPRGGFLHPFAYSPRHRRNPLAVLRDRLGPELIDRERGQCGHDQQQSQERSERRWRRRLRRRRAKPFDRVREDRRGGAVAAVWPDEGRDEALCFGACCRRVAKAVAQLAHVLIERRSDAQEAAVFGQQMVEVNGAFLRVRELRREHGADRPSMMAASIIALVLMPTTTAQ